MSNVLAFSCTHCPAMHPRYPAFLSRMSKKWKINKVVMLGDLVNWGCISYHEKDPRAPSQTDERNRAYKQVQKLYRLFPQATWLIGNHDALTERKAITAGLDPDRLKSYQDDWGVANWNVVPRYGRTIIDGVIYQHGDRGKGGAYSPAYRNMLDEFRSVVQGHWHMRAGVLHFANETKEAFGMQVGCGVQHDDPAFSYGNKYNGKPIVGCGIVLGGRTAFFEPMPL